METLPYYLISAEMQHAARQQTFLEDPAALQKRGVLYCATTVRLAAFKVRDRPAAPDWKRRVSIVQGQ
ncbi:hypothetical protein NPX13_g6372 [Xylaria arbuscula]|uniref:Uncharacterized protein n=1 Tax=Xylaria arbuscula TaxID=114810 RepID=A0A9W8NCQ7_9PEZI|nr:hypothetical protein NPX13_g6372 [Xylaria arbuscula]